MANEPNYSSNPSKDEPKKEKVRVIPLEYIDEFPGHPFKVLDDESMQKLMNSIFCRNSGRWNLRVLRR